MHFLEVIFFVRHRTGILQTDESFAELLPHFVVANVTGTRGIIRRNEIGSAIFSLRMFNHNLPCLEKTFERRSINSNGTSCRHHFFLKPDSQSRAERPRRQGIQTLSLCLLVLSARS